MADCPGRAFKDLHTSAETIGMAMDAGFVGANLEDFSSVFFAPANVGGIMGAAAAR